MATDHVVNPQIWPQTNLQYEYVSKGVTFQQLDFKLFVAGELEIISSKNIGDKEKKARVALHKKNVYYSSVYHWKALLECYAAFVRQIESGQRSCGIVQSILKFLFCQSMSSRISINLITRLKRIINILQFGIVSYIKRTNVL